MAVIPVMIDLKSKKTVIIGGGKIANRRIETLLESETDMTVISPEATVEIQQWHRDGLIEWKKRDFSASDVTNAALIVIATNDEAVNTAVRNAAPSTSLINETSNAEAGNINFPARFKRGRLSISVSTNGASPILAKKIKQELESRYTKDYGKYLDFLFEARKLVKEANLSSKDKEAYLEAFLSEKFFDQNEQRKILDLLHTRIR